MKRIFGKDGLLAAALPNFELRLGQEAMADEAYFALENDEILLYEAPTGTGKTLAYLIPAIKSKRIIVISTGTKALQEQIVNKDLPLAEKVIGEQVKYAVMKGRQNYLCKFRLKLFNAQPMFATIDESKYFKKIQEWAIATKTGDREELSDFPDDFSAWSEINSNSNYCLGTKCSHLDGCFLFKMKQKAMLANIIIVNHHLFFADLAVRQSGVAEVIPTYMSVIFDEAHQIEDVATQFFGIQVSNFRIEELARDISRLLANIKMTDNKIVDRIRLLRNAADKFFGFFHRSGYEAKYRIYESDINEDAIKVHSFLIERLKALSESISNIDKKSAPEELLAIENRMLDLFKDLSKVFFLDDKKYVHWCEIRKGGVFLHASPIELKGPISDALFNCAPSLILTSATLSTDDNFEYLKDRLGLEKEVMEHIGPPCFDYQNQGVLYLPRDIPEPNGNGYIEVLADQMEKVLMASKGRGFCLFTSYKNMHAVHELLAPKLPFTVLLQGQGAKSALLEQFRQDEHSVLFATASFWGGVDVVGRALSVVLIDKLPFASPGEPIIESRIEALKEKEGNPFMNYQLPQAIITLKQGLGRLIRNRNDKGLMAVFDVRIRSRHYGRRIIRSMPDFPKTGDLDKVCLYLRKLYDDEKERGTPAREEVK